MLDTVKINHVQHISFTQSRLTDAVSVILSELLSYEHPSKPGDNFYALLVGWALLSGMVSGSSARASCLRSHTDRKKAQAIRGSTASAPRIYHHVTAK